MSTPMIAGSLVVALGIMLAQTPTPVTVKAVGCSFGDGAAPALSRAAAAAMANDGPIREAARIDGRVVTQPRVYPESVVTTLEGLARQSDVIVVGEVVACGGVDAGARVDTVYKVSLQEVLKGDLRKGAVIEVQLMGGHIDYPAGYYAETRIPGFRPPQLDDRLLLFLRGRPGSPEGVSIGPFLPSFFWFSSFHLTASGVVDPSYRSPDPATVASTTRGMPAEQLLTRIRALVKPAIYVSRGPANKRLQPAASGLFSR